MKCNKLKTVFLLLAIIFICSHNTIAQINIESYFKSSYWDTLAKFRIDENGFFQGHYIEENGALNSISYYRNDTLLSYKEYFFRMDYNGGKMLFKYREGNYLLYYYPNGKEECLIQTIDTLSKSNYIHHSMHSYKPYQIIFCYDLNGNDLNSGTFKNGNGYLKTYGNAGYLSEEGNYVKGEKEGLFKSYTFDHSLYIVGNYSKNKENGRWVKFTKSGQIDSEENYFNGKLDGKCMYYSDYSEKQKKIVERNYRVGELIKENISYTPR